MTWAEMRAIVANPRYDHLLTAGACAMRRAFGIEAAPIREAAADDDEEEAHRRRWARLMAGRIGCMDRPGHG